MSTQDLSIKLKTIITLVGCASLAGFFMGDNSGHNVVHMTTMVPFVAFVVVPILERIFGPRAPVVPQ